MKISLIHKIKKSGVLQQDSSDCGAACIATLLRFYGIHVNFENTREHCGTQGNGGNLLGLYQAAQHFGFKSGGAQGTVSDLKEINNPSILHFIMPNGLQHFVIFFTFHKNRFFLFDPAQGFLKMDEQTLSTLWSGNCLLIKGFAPVSDSLKTHKMQKLQWFWQYLKPDKSILFISIIMGSICSVMGLGISLFSQKLIDNILPKQNTYILIVALCALFIILVLQSISMYVKDHILLKQGSEFSTRLLSAFYKRFLALPLSFFENRKNGDLVARLNDCNRIQKNLSGLFGSSLAGDLLIALSASILLGIYHYSLPIILMLGFICMLIVSYYATPSITKSQQQVMVNHSICESNFMHTVEGIRCIKNENLSNSFTLQTNNIYTKFQQSIFQLGIINIKLRLFYQITGIIMVISTLLIGGFLVVKSQLTAGELIACLSLCSLVSPTLISLSLIPIPISEATVAFDRLYESSNIDLNHINSVDFTNPITQIDIENLGFAYRAGKPILQNLNYHFGIGKLYCINGQCGRGKTTLCKLLEKSYTSYSGNILINGEHELQKINTFAWKNKIGVISQEPFLFNATIFENIALHANSQEEIQNALRICEEYHIVERFKNLSQGIFSTIGENGIQLSGGEKQLVALARILIKNPDVLILDEPTAAMDQDLENFTWNTFIKLSKKKIVCVVTHKKHILEQYKENINTLIL